MSRRTAELASIWCCHAMAACLVTALPLAAQSVSPPIVEYQEKASSSFQLHNGSLFPLTVVLEVRGFRVTEAGDVIDLPLDTSRVQVKLSAMSFRIPPRGSYRVFYEARADSLPAWFNVLSAMSGVRTDDGLNVRLLLPHVVYLNQKQPLKKHEVAIRAFEFDAAGKRMLIQLENLGTHLGRVLQVNVTDGQVTSAPAGGFPLFPRSRRWTEVPWQGEAPANRVTLRFGPLHHRYRTRRHPACARNRYERGLRPPVTSAQLTVSRKCRLGLLACALLSLPGSAAAQTVVEVEGGGSTLNGGYGATASFWRSGVDGWIGLGYLNGVRAGAFLRKSLGRDTLGIGNDALVMRLPTDVFTPGFNLLVQGVSFHGGNERTSYLLFAGASSDGLGAPAFQATSVEEPMGALFVQHRVARTVRLSATTLFADQQTALPGVQWQPTPDVTTSLVAGVGSGRSYAASSVLLRQGGLGVKASYAWNPDRFRRAAVARPNQTEVDRENIMVTYDLSPQFTVGVGRQNYVQDSADSRSPVRATGNTAFAGGVWSATRLAAGLYDSRSEGTSNLSSFVAVGRELADWLDAELFILQSRPEGRPTSTTPLANLRWRLSSRLALSQQISFHGRRPTVLLGASLMTPIGDFAADYQIVHQPFQPFSPFRSALNITARLQLGRYSTSIGTFVQPDGSMNYSASGSTFLYMGSFGGIQPQAIGGRMARYIVRGIVCDEEGNPVEGAAVEIGTQVVFTNSTGQFFHRLGRPGRSPLRVLTREFLLPGNWEVVSAPADAVAGSETEPGIEIVLRHPAPPGGQ